MFRIVIPVAVALAFAAGLAPIAMTPARAQSEAADTMFWDSVKTSKDPDEVRAYLEKFPNGMFAPLARIRLKNLEGAGASKAAAPPSGSSIPPQTPPSFSPSPSPQPAPTPPSQTTKSAPPPPSAPPPSKTTSALTGPEVVREIQDRLYNLNYVVGARNGRVTPQTQDAIRKWQENVKEPVTGDMTEAQLALLRRARAPTTWGALAYFAKGASSTVWNRPSREAAEKEALEACRKNAGGTCSVVTVANDICAALGFYNAVVSGKQHWGAYAIVRPTLGQATDSALAECRKQSKQQSACGVRTTVCADGGHRR